MMRGLRRAGAFRRWTPRAGVVLLAATAMAAPRAVRAPPAEPLLVASDEPLVLRFAKPAPSSRVGSQAMQIVADGTGEPARGQYVAGTFLRDPTTGLTEVIDPEMFRQAVQATLGLDRDAARSFVERALERFARTGRTADLAPLTGAVNSVEAGAQEDSSDSLFWWNTQLNSGDLGFPTTLSQQMAAGSQTLGAIRILAAGDDALWAAHIAGDTTAFSKLAADPRFERFWHAPDPLTGGVRAESEFRRREHRRVMLTHTPTTRTLTFVPDVPQAVGMIDAGLAENTRFRVDIAAFLPGPLGLSDSRGNRLALHRRTSAFDTTPVDGEFFRLSELDQPLIRLAPRVVDVTPPNGETLVDPTTDWEDPDDRLHVAFADRRPFSVRLRFNKPLDPNTVSPVAFTLTCIAVAVGSANESAGSIPTPAYVRLRQSRLGAVEVQLVPGVRLEPAATYQVVVRSLVKSLDGRSNSLEYMTTFTTAPASADDAPVQGLDADFGSSPLWNWYEADVAKPRALILADSAHDPDGRGLFVPFLGADPVPVVAIETGWIDSGSAAPKYTLVFDDPTAPTGQGTSIHVPAGAAVRVFIDTAPQDIASSYLSPNVYAESGWQELTQADPSSSWPYESKRFFRMRVEFTLQPGATPATLDLPSIDRLTLRAERL